jgi:hypothetical protein
MNRLLPPMTAKIAMTVKVECQDYMPSFNAKFGDQD